MDYAQVRQITVEEDGRLRIEGLSVRAGDRVQVVVIPQQMPVAESARYPLHGQPLRYDRPFDPAAESGDWEANH
jgi:hypothetical protein